MKVAGVYTRRATARRIIGTGACGLLICTAGVALPITAALSQETETKGDVTNKKIDLDLESSNLYYGLKLLFSQVKANFTIDESLKSLSVTAHLTQVPFRVALETLLKSTNTPLTYKVENGIYSVVPKVEAPDEKPEPVNTPEPAPTTGGGYKYGIIHTNNMSAIDIAYALGGHIVSVGYDPKLYGTGGLGGTGGGFGMATGIGSGIGGGYGGFGGGAGGYGGGVGGGFGGFGGGGYGGYGGGVAAPGGGILGGGGLGGGIGGPGNRL